MTASSPRASTCASPTASSSPRPASPTRSAATPSTPGPEAGYGTGADDVSRATDIAITSHAAHRITDAEIAEADLLLAMTDSHWNILQRRAAGLGAEPSRIRMYREFDPAAAPQTEAVAAGRASRGVLNVPDPWYGTMADFADTLEGVERVSDELADELAARLD